MRHSHFASVSAEEERVSDFELKLMDIDSEHLGIPDTDYAATVNLPAAEYQRICRDLSSIGDTGGVEGLRVLRRLLGYFAIRDKS
jgi:proliferating cell nuclear antigen